LRRSKSRRSKLIKNTIVTFVDEEFFATVFEATISEFKVKIKINLQKTYFPYILFI